MSDLSELNCTLCGVPLERVRYFPRQLLTADDMTTEQNQHREKVRRHNRFLHGWGVVCGCTVEAINGVVGRVRVCPGYAVGPDGNEICIDRIVEVDLSLGVQDPVCTVQPCPPVGEMPAPSDGPSIAYVAVRYAECHTRPVRVHPTGCGCNETNCEYSRVRETFEIKLLRALPASHRIAAQEDSQWCSLLDKVDRKQLRKSLSVPVPPCPQGSEDPWVVLATLTLSRRQPDAQADGGGANNALRIAYDDRRVLLSTQRLTTAMLCLLDSG